MRVLVTGACGFVGAALVRRLIGDPQALHRAAGRPAQELLTLVLLDRDASALEHATPAGVRAVVQAGDIADSRLLRRALADGIDLAFHLASVPGGAAEQNPALGRRVNLDATLDLFEQLAEQPRPPRVVFASSIAVYGAPLPAQVGPETPPRPRLSYGAHKLVAEILLADLSRRGRVDGVSLRLPGIVARPLAPSGLVSAYMSDILRRVAAGEPFTCPVSPQATSWWMSARCCVDNLLHAAHVDTAGIDVRRALPLPVLHASMRQIVDALGRLYGEQAAAGVRWAPDEKIEALFGRYPPLDAGDAEALGFRHDGSIEALVRHALNDDSP